MDEVIIAVKMVFVMHLLMAISLLIGVWIGRRSCNHEDR